ncbi:MAG: esterase/lipase family protein [Thiobacillus sp.]
MQALFVHGMGRSTLSGWYLLKRLRAQGITPLAFGYAATFQRFTPIRERLTSRISALAAAGDYVLIGHSLGGVLLRAAVAALPQGTRPPRHIFLLASPIQPARLAQKLQRNWMYRVLAGDCGQLLASSTRMAQIGAGSVPVTSILGVTGWKGWLNPFDGELNDGIVSVSEASAAWITEEIRIPTIHTYLPSSKQVSEIILKRIAALQDAATSTSPS